MHDLRFCSAVGGEAGVWVGMTKPILCRGCGNLVPHRHMHDAAHGIYGTHMAGSERFECSGCGLRTLASDKVDGFEFILDKA